MSRDTRYTTASELAEYVYCHRAWWLHHMRAFEPAHQEALSHGRDAHSRHGRRVLLSEWLVRLGWLMILVAVLTLGVLLGQ